MRYAVKGADQSTRVPVFREFSGDSEQDAVRLAERQGVVVEKIWRVP